MPRKTNKRKAIQAAKRKADAKAKPKDKIRTYDLSTRKMTPFEILSLITSNPEKREQL